MLRVRHILVDTNVWLYYFLGREPDCRTITSLFKRSDELGITLLYAPTSYKDVFYLIPRQMRHDAIAAGVTEPPSFAPAAWACIDTMSQLAVAATQSLIECSLARSLRGRHADLEDNLVMATAETSNADYVVTYDKELIAHFAPACVTPEQMLAFLQPEQAS